MGRHKKRVAYPQQNSAEYIKYLHRIRMLSWMNRKVIRGYDDNDKRAIDLGLYYQQLRRERTDKQFYKLFSTRDKTVKGAAIWRNLRLAVDIIDENGYDMAEFVVAQFDELDKFYKFPFPTVKTLSGAGAVDRCDRWLMKRKKRGDSASPMTTGEKNAARGEDVKYVLKELGLKE